MKILHFGFIEQWTDLRNIKKLFHVEDTSFLDDIRDVYEMSKKILEKEKVSYDHVDSEDEPFDSSETYEDTDVPDEIVIPKQLKKKRKSELEKLKIDMKGWDSAVLGCISKEQIVHRSFQEDMMVSKAMFPSDELNFDYKFNEDYLRREQKVETQGLRDLKLSAAPFIHNLVSSIASNLSENFEHSYKKEAFAEEQDELFDQVEDDDDCFDVYLV